LNAHFPRQFDGRDKPEHDLALVLLDLPFGHAHSYMGLLSKEAVGSSMCSHDAVCAQSVPGAGGFECTRRLWSPLDDNAHTSWPFDSHEWELDKAVHEGTDDTGLYYPDPNSPYGDSVVAVVAHRHAALCNSLHTAYATELTADSVSWAGERIDYVRTVRAVEFRVTAPALSRDVVMSGTVLPLKTA
jgi:hypothetical protein